jgi:hypothetical protein
MAGWSAVRMNCVEFETYERRQLHTPLDAHCARSPDALSRVLIVGPPTRYAGRQSSISVQFFSYLHMTLRL